MAFLDSLIDNPSLQLGETVARLVLAALLGAVLGFEREQVSRPAGLRTHILVSLACATMAIITVEIIERPLFGSHDLKPDPIRLVEAITAGVAFLAAGFIIFHKGEIHGVTTGAGMWLAAAIGLAAGLGFYRLAGLACLAGFIVLAVLRKVEQRLNIKNSDK